MSATTLRRTQIGLLLVGCVVTIMLVVVVAGCFANDSSIEKHRATATADVVTAGATKSTVRFYTQSGELRSPRLGIFYPTELTAGQRISVEYDSTNPDLVRVAGRDASLSIIPAISIIGYTWLLIVVVMVLLAEVTRRRGRAVGTGAPDPVGSDPATPDPARADDEQPVN